MSKCYGIAELFSLVARLLAPFVDPLRAEFATRPEPSREQPSPATLADAAPLLAQEQPQTPAQHPAGGEVPQPLVQGVEVSDVQPDLFGGEPPVPVQGTPEVIVVTTVRDRITAERVTTAAEEVFFVRLPGKQVRYREARDTDRGQRFALSHTPKGRKKYTPVSVTKFGAKAK